MQKKKKTGATAILYRNIGLCEERKEGKKERAPLAMLSRVGSME
jgi:hypothetical protein